MYVKAALALSFAACLDTDLAAQLSSATLGARLWRLTPGRASTRHRIG